MSIKKMLKYIGSALALLPSAGIAGVIIQAQTISSNAPIYDNTYNLSNVIDQSGLRWNYTSGVTDFDFYLSSNTDGRPPISHENVAEYGLGFAEGVSDISLLLGFGELVTIESLALWNRATGSQGIKTFSLTASTDASFSSEIFIGNFFADTGLNYSGDSLAQTFEFTPVSASFVRMDISSHYGNLGVSFDELAFERHVNVPEPNPLFLFVISTLLISVRYKLATWISTK
ncbi:hypothetical protein [Teredinibacter sp. KSP-S5-2]|uniref:hypothetical protein n=1 Tax=Teredinibacter sp. KSP-S5-2 TaxID=3034506 RepID=UPI0029341826|nr:hypothetical protein [Teredinibacter sp. KSP-S5-2]WNO11176.1 hypothetical protein P5V12_08320 [Teredinibacter sp. KSP-S5-2]